MTDPTDALISFQQALLANEIELTGGETDPTIFAFLDHPNGEIRITYVTLEKQIVTSMAIIVMTEPYEGLRCFGIGWAVPAKFRNEGRAKAIVNAAILEFTNGMARNSITTFYVEAIVGAENIASQRVAERTITHTAKATTDVVSGMPAFAYVRKIESGPPM